MQSLALIGDLHWNDKDQDSYRFDLVPWLVEQSRHFKVRKWFILGDLTDVKDRHPAALVNTLVSTLAEVPYPITILMGNHDYIDPRWPFFGFLDRLPNCIYISKPTVKTFGQDVIALLPHTKTPKADWHPYRVGVTQHTVVLTHMTVTGAKVGKRELEGMPYSFIKLLHAPVFSGDVHKAQKIGKLEYVGSPYDIDFGDETERSAIIFDHKGQRFEPLFPAPRKRTIEAASLEQLEHKTKVVKSGDMVQVRFVTDFTEADTFAETQEKIKLIVRDRNAVWCHTQMLLQTTDADASNLSSNPPSIAEAFDQFIEEHKLSAELVAVGRECLEKS